MHYVASSAHYIYIIYILIQYAKGSLVLQSVVITNYSIMQQDSKS